LGVARAVATQPRLLLLDEPLGGMNPEEIIFSIEVISKLRDSGMTVLIVEHNMQILDLCDRVFVISFGEKIFEGTPAEVRNDETVIETYFGGVAV
jgi:branched-chain amino acid transport system ATP-binding protein